MRRTKPTDGAQAKGSSTTSAVDATKSTTDPTLNRDVKQGGSVPPRARWSFGWLLDFVSGGRTEEPSHTKTASKSILRRIIEWITPSANSSEHVSAGTADVSDPNSNQAPVSNTGGLTADGAHIPSDSKKKSSEFRLEGSQINSEKRATILDFLNRSIRESDKSNRTHITQMSKYKITYIQGNVGSEFTVPNQYVTDYNRSRQTVSFYSPNKPDGQIIENDTENIRNALDRSVTAIIDLCKGDLLWARYVMAYSNQTSTVPLLEALMNETLKLIDKPEELPEVFIQGSPKSLSYHVDKYQEGQDNVKIDISCTFPIIGMPDAEPNENTINGGEVTITGELLIPKPTEVENKIKCEPEFVNADVQYYITGEMIAKRKNKTSVEA